jgi:hypothetical protein
MLARLAVVLTASCSLALTALCVVVGSAAGADAPPGPVCAEAVVGKSTISDPNLSELNVSGLTASPGSPCWTEVDPYPFGIEGGPVDMSDPQCAPVSPPGPGWVGDQVSCYLTVTSLAFRAWNRGLAAVTTSGSNPNATTAFGVWIYNGARWFPDATFPGQTACKGTTVLWAGKRDYWLVGARNNDWPALCRFDGLNFEWTPIAVPPEALARVPLDSTTGKPQPGAIRTGACFSWDNCWFFGDLGITLRWDGFTLSDATPDTTNAPWLASRFSAASTRPDQSGNVASVVVSASGGPLKGEQVPAGPGGTAPPQAFFSTGGAFTPLPFSPPTVGVGGDPYRTDLIAVDRDQHAAAWVAGDPVGYRPAFNFTGTPFPSERRTNTTQPAPVMRIASDGSVKQCAAAPPNTFSFSNGATGTRTYLWSSIASIPTANQSDAGSAVVGGQLRPASRGPNMNDDGRQEPLIAQIACDSARTETRFRMPDPFAADQANTTRVPANRLGFVTAAAANAFNDAWAASTKGTVSNGAVPPQQFPVRPRLYHLTDGAAPQAPAGDDNETRTPFFEPDPPIFVEAPPELPPLPPVTTITQQAPTKKKSVRLKSPIYNVKAKVRARGRSGVALVITFKVRRAVRIGAQALRRGHVVSSSGLKRFRKGQRGTLVLRLSRARWPTGVKFVFPKKRPAGT